MLLKIGDFGLANEIVNNERRYTVCGTVNYLAPEIFSNNSIDNNSKGHSY